MLQYTYLCSSQNNRMDWFGRDLNTYLPNPHHGHGCHPLNLVAQGPIQPRDTACHQAPSNPASQLLSCREEPTLQIQFGDEAVMWDHVEGLAEVQVDGICQLV